MALIVWADIMLKISKDDSFIPRRKYIKKKFNIKTFTLNKIMKFLKGVGLVETFPLYKKGKAIGSEYKFYNLENAVSYPSPTNTPGPQSHTKAISDMKGKKNINQQTRTLLNGNVSECSFFRLSEKRTIYLQGVCSGSAFEGGGKSDFRSPDNHKNVFLAHFLGQNTFQTFDDSPKKKRHLSKIYNTHNSMNLHAKNDQGAGIFLTVNETDGKGRSKKNITRVRAVFADLDGAPLEPVLEYCPSLIVESSPNRYHAYWMTYDTPLESFTRIQKAIANKFGSDPKVSDLNRVMRIPGYYHSKKEPVLSRVLFSNKLKYSFDELKTMFPERPSIQNVFNGNPEKSFTTHGAHKGQRNSQLCKIIGAMKKRNSSDDKIKEQAYKFAKDCTPPLKSSEVISVLRASSQWA